VLGDWTMGERSKRLTPAGREAVVRLIQAGGGDTEIGKAVGVHRETVRRIRKELRKELHPI
jgi:DNA invertase Pin-like site-specific DNA recombinase